MSRRAPLAALVAALTSATLVAVPPVAGAAPVPDPVVLDGTGALGLTPLSSLETGQFDESAAEIVAHDPATQRLFVVNAAAGIVDVADVRDPSAPTFTGTLDPTGVAAADGSTIPSGTQVNSVDVRDDGLVALAVEAPDKTAAGWVALFDTDGDAFGAVRVGALPDMLTFTPDGQRLLVANEGEPADDFSVDPEGSVSVVDVSGEPAAIGQEQVRTADFRAFDEPGALPTGVRVFGPDVPDADGVEGAGRVARNLEPEYVVPAPDGATARVVLQEANALAVLDVAAAEIVSLQPLGTKDHSRPGDELDASDRDPRDAPEVTIRDWPVQGLYLPDAAASYEVDGATYVVTANEGDAREWGDYVEPERVKDLTLCEDATFGGYVGEDAEFATVAELQQDANLGRLNVSTAHGQRDGEGCYEALYSLGARSFSIWDEDGQLVFDSGSAFERLTAEAAPAFFNANNDEAALEARSDDKGPEPEAVTVAELGGRTYAFVGFERVGGIAVYDVSEPTAPTFVTYVNNRDFAAYEGDEPTPDELTAAGDLGPEGLVVIDPADSPLPGVPLLVVANEVSGTTTLFTIDGVEAPLPTPPYDRGIGSACPGTYPAAFTDVAGNVHEAAIRCAAAAGLTEGTSDPTRYAPRRGVTRGQMASFVARFVEAATGERLPAGRDAFGDDDGSVHEANIDALTAAGVVEGLLGGGFGPNQAVTRAQIASLLDRALDLVHGDALDRSFPPATDLDVFGDDDGSVHEPAIDRLAAQGVVQGSVDGRYRPGRTVTRDQLASFLLRAFDLAVDEGLAAPVG